MKEDNKVSEAISEAFLKDNAGMLAGKISVLG